VDNQELQAEIMALQILAVVEVAVVILLMEHLGTGGSGGSGVVIIRYKIAIIMTSTV
jgi:hypothetical protein